MPKAAEWKAQDPGHRGAVYYSLFENRSKQFPEPSDLLAWEHAANFAGDPPFRVLRDYGFLPNAIGGGSMPYVWVLDEKMVVQLVATAPPEHEVFLLMERLMGL